MIPEFALTKTSAVLLLATIAIVGAGWYRQALISDGVRQESDRRDKRAKDALIEANAAVAKAGKQILALQGQLSKLQTENQDAQIASKVTESALRAGTERLRVQLAAYRTGQAGSPGNPAAAIVDNGAAIVEDLAPAVAGNLESLRRNENNAIDRLNACVIAYEKVREQVNGLK